MPSSTKKALILNILEILRRYSDENHRLSQTDIIEYLRKDYDMIIERKSIRRNIIELMNCGYEIEYSETVRMVPNRKTGEPEESYIWSDFYLVREFTDSELRLLIDGLLFSKHIPYSQCKELVEKLEGLSNNYFRSRVRHIRTMPDNVPPNKQLFYSIEILDEAISRKRQVSFHYLEYGTDKLQHPRLKADGTIRKYVINPIQMAAANGRYYLIGNTEPYENVSHYRLDRIADIRLLEQPSRMPEQIKELENGINLPQHMAEHVYMFSGESEPVRFRIKKQILNDVIDWFGTDIGFSDETPEEVTVQVRVNLHAMQIWAVQYGPYVRVLSPERLAGAVEHDLETALSNYRCDSEERT